MEGGSRGGPPIGADVEDAAPVHRHLVAGGDGRVEEEAEVVLAADVPLRGVDRGAAGGVAVGELVTPGGAPQPGTLPSDAGGVVGFCGCAGGVVGFGVGLGVVVGFGVGVGVGVGVGFGGGVTAGLSSRTSGRRS